MRISLALSLGAAALVGAAGQSRAVVLFDSQGFESSAYILGNLAGQNGWTQDHGLTAPAQVQSTTVQSGTQAVQLNVTTDGTNWLFPIINYTPASGEIVQVSADIARTLGATTGTTSFGWFLDIYGNDGNRIARAGLGNSAGAVRAILTTSGGNFLANATVYQPGEWVHFDVLLNFATHTYDLVINGVVAVSNIPMVTSAATGLADADLQISTSATATDTGFFDNYVVQTVPGPGSAVLMGMGGLLAARRRRR